jgi:hypothetical protein
MSCVKELTTQHRGHGHGHGCVQPDEILVLAVFQSTKTVGTRLAPTAFKSADLHRGNVSVSRLRYTTRQIFDAEVVASRAAADPLKGVVVCAAYVLRGLLVAVPHSTPPTQIRAVCVLDKVEPSDHGGHAALEYCETQQNITNQQTKSMLRAEIGLALASAFSEILTPDSVFIPVTG